MSQRIAWARRIDYLMVNPSPEYVSGGVGRWISISLLFLTVTACDAVDAGRAEESPDPPVLLKITVQSSNRGLLADLLDRGPEVACSLTNPCPVDEPGSPICRIPEGATEGICPRAYSVREVPPPVDPSSNEIRLVFDKVLDPSIAAEIERGDSVVALVGPDGMSVATRLRYEPSGAPRFSSNAFIFPYGPALALLTDDPLFAASTYELRLDLARIRDKKGQQAIRDSNGAIQASYQFTTESFHVAASSLSAAGQPPVIAPNQALTLALNAPFDERSATSSTSGTSVVRTASGDPVPVEVFAFRGHVTETSSCASAFDPLILEIVPISSDGDATRWLEGDYRLDLGVIRDAGTGLAALKSDPHGSEAFEATFSVSGSLLDPTDPSAGESLVLPWQCGDQ
jgi:hypothetical protein